MLDGERVDGRAARRPRASRRGCRRGAPARAPPGRRGSRKTSSCASSRSFSSGTRGGLLDAVGVVEDDAEVADPPDAGLGADRRLAGLDARVAERALLGLAGLPVEVDLLVGAAARRTCASRGTLLVDEHDAVLLALVHRARRARGDARRVEAVLADARQVHHERLLVLEPHRLLDAVAEVRVGGGASRARRRGRPPSSGPTRGRAARR